MVCIVMEKCRAALNLVGTFFFVRVTWGGLDGWLVRRLALNEIDEGFNTKEASHIHTTNHGRPFRLRA